MALVAAGCGSKGVVAPTPQTVVGSLPTATGVAKGDAAAGKQLYTSNGCGGCHTFKAAGSTGTVGPDLDKVLPGMTAAQVKQSIVNPNAKITPGFPPNTMPQNFGQTIQPKDLTLLVNFLLGGSTGKGGSGSGG